MSPLRLNGSDSGYSQLEAPAIAGDQTFTLPGTGGTLVTTASAGKILQVVNATYSTQASNAASSYLDTGLTATITPSSATSKVLITVFQAGILKISGDAYVKIRLLANGSEIVLFEKVAAYTGTSTANNAAAGGCSFLHSPSTTSAIIYKTQFAQPGGAGGSAFVQHDGATSTITLMEVAA